mmetsp:Transcript_6949/g.24334  ORF Transcript_6949/g.24334 Transcript_6949/m.24334 type:complete len:86 (-) Transcript_6949:2314-2571(-)
MITPNNDHIVVEVSSGSQSSFLSLPAVATDRATPGNFCVHVNWATEGKGSSSLNPVQQRGQGSEVELAGYLQVSGQHEPLLVWKT